MGSRVLRHLCTSPTSITTPTPAAAHREHHLQLWCQRHGCDGGIGGWPAAGSGDGLKFLCKLAFCQLPKVLARIEGTQKRNRPFQLHVSDRTLGKLL